MVDADKVGTNEATTPQTRHWLVNGVRLQGGEDGGAPYSLNYTGSTSVYVSPVRSKTGLKTAVCTRTFLYLLTPQTNRKNSTDK